ncbi:MAG: GerMN domain-containing protein, partial [Actinobacteria bacterium]|nr:GerMN domain-containing protein [Actinomycetota bacterium]
KKIKDNSYYQKKYNNDKGRENAQGRIIGSEYKVKPPRKKRRSSPALRLTILIIIVFLAGFFTFYAIDNHLFSKDKTIADTADTLKVNSLSDNSQPANQESKNSVNIQASQESTQLANNNTQGSNSPQEASNKQIDSSNANNINNTNNSTDNISNASGVTDTVANANTASNANKSLWQALILFFKNFGKQQIEKSTYPRELKLNFYFAVIGNEGKFGVEQRTIPAGNAKNAVMNAVNELLKGPYENFNFAVIPAGTKLLGAEVSNNIAKINFSQEFLSESLDSRILDEYIIYTIVDTLTQIPDIQAVSFSIDGKDITEYGNVDLRLPAIRNEKYLENKK